MFRLLVVSFSARVDGPLSAGLSSRCSTQCLASHCLALRVMTGKVLAAFYVLLGCL